MENRETLENYRKPEEKMLLAQILDKVESCKKSGRIEYTNFLDMYQIQLVKNFMQKNKIENYTLFGGFEDSERKIAIIYPEDYTENMVQKNYSKMLKVIRITVAEDEKGKYVHRNYLGGIVKVGIAREKVGDILVFDEGADIIVKTETAEALKQALGSLTRFQNSKIEIVELENLRKREIKLEEIKIIVPSLRLDNFVSDLAKTSRNKAVQIMENQRVFVNGQNEIKASKQIKEGDVITIRGKGRFVVKKFGGTTRSGRTIVEIEKY